MQEFCNSMSRTSPDAYEYAYLKAVVLFSPGERNWILSEKYEGNGEKKKVRMELIVCVFVIDHSGVDGTLQIERFQEKAYMELQDYVSKVYPEDTYRWVTIVACVCPTSHHRFSIIKCIIMV